MAGDYAFVVKDLCKVVPDVVLDRLRKLEGVTLG